MKEKMVYIIGLRKQKMYNIGLNFCIDAVWFNCAKLSDPEGFPFQDDVLAMVANHFNSHKGYI